MIKKEMMMRTLKFIKRKMLLKKEVKKKIITITIVLYVIKINVTLFAQEIVSSICIKNA